MSDRIYKQGTTLADMRKSGFPYGASEEIASKGVGGKRAAIRRCTGCNRPFETNVVGHDEAGCVAVHNAPPYMPAAPRLLRPRRAGQDEMLRMLREPRV